MAKVNANENITVTVTISGKAKDVANVQKFMKENNVKYSQCNNQKHYQYPFQNIFSCFIFLRHNMYF